jgi:hypothetical protein
LYATARPPASSAGLTIRLPEDNLAKLFRRESLARDRLNEAVVALVFVFTTIGMLGFLLEFELRRRRTSCSVDYVDAAFSYIYKWMVSLNCLNGVVLMRCVFLIQAG